MMLSQQNQPNVVRRGQIRLDHLVDVATRNRILKCHVLSPIHTYIYLHIYMWVCTFKNPYERRSGLRMDL